MNQRSPKKSLLDETRETLELDPTSTPPPHGVVEQDEDKPASPSRYVVVEEFARGGLGRILKAHDERLDRPVAIKEMLEGGDSAILRERFERETAITARLQHPAIVPIYDAGKRANGGPPFYVMKLLSDNRTLGQAIAQASSLKERLSLLPNVIAVADAIAYAHSLDIIHRDIKPSNVLLGPFGETVVIDWGLAKELSRAAPPEPLHATPYRSAAPDVTSIGSVVGTPHYMAPEQARGEKVDARADVYSLGAMLYHVLCGAPPFGDLSQRDVLACLVAAPPPPLDEKAPGVPADLVAVVAKAMERDPARRYRNASELTGDLKRFEAGQLVGAHHYSTGALVLRWLHRYRLPAAVALIFLLALAAVGAGSVRRIRSERAVAVAQRNSLILAQAAAALETDPTLALEWLKTYPASGADWDGAQVLAADAESRGVARHILPTMATVIAMSSDGTSVLSGGPDPLVKVWRIADGAKLAAGSFGAPIMAARFAPDGKSIAVCNRNGDVVIWTPSSDRRTPLLHLDGGAFYVYYSADGKSLVVSGLKSVVVWDLAAGRPSWQTSTHETVTALAMSRDGATVAFGTVDGTLHLVDVAQGAVRRFAGHVGAINSFEFSRDGKRLLTGGMDHTIRLWEVARGAGRLIGTHDGLIRDVHFSPSDPNLAASGGADFKVRLWRLDGGGARVLAGHTDIVDDFIFSPDGRTIASCSPDRRVRLWDVATGDSRLLLGHRGVLGDLLFTPDSKTLVSSGYDPVGMRVWPVDEPRGRLLGRHDLEVVQALISPNGRVVASSGTDRLARLWDLATGAERLLPGALYAAMVASSGITFSGDGTLLAAAGDNTAHLWNLATGETRTFVVPQTVLRRMALSTDGKRLAAAGSDGTVRWWDLASGRETVLVGHRGEATHLLFAPAGDLLVSGGADGTVRLWRLATGEGSVLGQPGAATSQLVFSRDGTSLASGASDGAIWLWDVASRRGRRFSGHRDSISGLRFAPDGHLLASASLDKTVRVWDVATGQARVLTQHDEPVRQIAFSPDGRVVASVSNDRTIRLTSLATGAITVLRGHEGVVRSVDFEADGRRLVSASEDKAVRLWTLSAAPAVPRGATRLIPWIANQTSATLAVDALGSTAPSGAH